MPYHVYMQCPHLRITPTQHKVIREIVGFKYSEYLQEPFSSEPIDVRQANMIAEFITGNSQHNWVDYTFERFQYKTRPFISLSIFMTSLIGEFKIGSTSPGETYSPAIYTHKPLLNSRI